MHTERKFTIAIILAAIAATILCMTVLADGSSADTSGSVLDSDDNVVGTYSLDGHTLTLQASSVSAVLSVKITTLSAAEINNVQTIVVRDFVNNLYSSFSDYPYLDTMEYRGLASTGGTWTFEYFSGAVTLTANGDSGVDYLELSNFNMRSLVTSVLVYGYQEDLSGSFDSYSSLDNNITYAGSFGGTYGGLWEYSIKTKTLTVDRPQSSTSNTPGTYNTTNAPFREMFFKDDAENVIYKTFTGTSQDLFWGLTAVKTFRGTEYTAYQYNNILDGLESTLEELRYDSIIAVERNTLETVRSSLKVFEAAKATQVGARTFINATSLSTVSLPLATTIGEYAFYGCTSLEIVNLSSAVTIGQRAFEECAALRNISLPSATTLYNLVFSGCAQLRTVSLPSATTIGTSCFSNLPSLTSVTFGSQVSLGESAFAGCSNLISVTTSNISSIGLNAFNGCSSLTGEDGKFTLTYLSRIYSDSSRYPFRDCDSITAVIMPAITTMDPYSFYGLTGLTTVTIGNHLGELPSYAFAACTALNSITLGNDIVDIGDHAFYGCTALVNLDIPNSVEILGDYSFANSGITEIDTNKTVTIGSNAFRASAITTLTFGDALETIGSEAFRASSLSGTLIFPSSVVEVGEYSFADTQIEEVDFLDEGMVTTATIDDNAFRACSKLLIVRLGEKISSIGNDSFYNCPMLVTLSFGSNLESVGDRAFYGCNSLSTELVIPVKMTYIGVNAFRGTSVRSLTFVEGSRLTTISESAFQDCRSLRQAIQFPDSLTSIGNNAFNNSVVRGISFNVATSKLAGIGDGAFQSCSSLGGTLDLPVNVTSVGNNAFNGCNFSSVNLGSKIQNLGQYAFANNGSLSQIVIPNTTNSLTLSAHLFHGCPLTDIYISSSVTSIAADAFNCSTITTSQVNVWFNGPLDNIALANAAFTFVNTATLNVYADPSSEDTAKSLVSSGKVTKVAGVVYNERMSATVGFRITDATPLYNSVTAVYGSKILLPYYVKGSVYGISYFAVVDNTPSYLAVFASEADFEADRVARSGDIISVYPLSDAERITMQGSDDTTGYIKEMTITTDSSGLPVDIETQTTHYGGTIVIPQFLQSEVIHVNSITLFVADGMKSYSLPIDTASVFAGVYYNGITLGYEDVMIQVTFISKGDTEFAMVKLRSSFELPPELSYMEQEPAGYRFDGWWDDATGGVKAIVGVTPFDTGDVWYAHFVPVDYTLELRSTAGSPTYDNSWTMHGPYVLHVVSNSLYYTDAVQTENKLLFAGDTIPGWSVANYEDNSGRTITGDTDPMTGDRTGANSIFIRMSMNNYDFTLRFYSGGVELPSSETFYIRGWAIGEGDEYHSGSTISGVSYSYIENGLDMPIPTNQTHAFNNMIGGNATIPNIDGKYTLTLDYFEGAQSITIRYNVDTGVYTVQFVMNDDVETTAVAGTYAVGDDVWMIAADYYEKIGYQFSSYSIPGSASQYSDRRYVTITDGMAANASFCVITVSANWNAIDYTVSFDLSPYEYVPSTQTVVNGGAVVLPDVSGYHGWTAVSWYWFKGAEKSATFTADTVLTSDIISDYADGTNLSIGVNWELKTYKANVRGDTTYSVINDLKLGDTFTLWTPTYIQPFKEFAGWAIDDTIYPEGEVVFDAIMAEAGDGNSDTVSFVLTVVDIRYHVQYNPNGGSGNIEDLNTYVIGDPFHVAIPDESVFYKYGYSFVGWKYSLDDDVIYDDTGVFKEELARNADANNTVIFYAVWAQKSYKINYELEGGRYGPSAPTNVRYGDAVEISNPTRVGYKFSGWTATGLTSGALYYSKSGNFMHWNGTLVDATIFRDLTDRSTETAIASVTLTAHWEEASYSTEYLPNGGAWSSISSTQYQISIGDIIELPTVRDPKKTGYAFAGWGIDTVNTIPSGTRLTEAMISDSSKFTLYAIWTPIVYQIQYRYTEDYQYSIINVDYGISAFVPILDRPGYNFRGWTISGAGMEAEYSRDGVEWYRLGSSLVNGTYFRNMASDAGTIVTMDAEWENVEYRLAYNTNGGTGKAPVDSNVYQVGDPVVMKDYKDLIGTNGSKVIIGWSLEINGSAVNITEFTQGLCTVADATNTVNLYGVWVNDMCSVIVDLEGCSTSGVPAGWVLNADGTYEKMVNYGTNTKDALTDWDDVILSKDGYSFSGWDYDTSVVMSSVTAYPSFEKVEMKIMYVFGGVIALFAAMAIVVTRF